MDQFRNFSYTTVATAPSPASSGTSLVVAAATGTVFPVAPFNAVVWPAAVQPSNANAEIVRVTTVATDTLTITRQLEGTSARSIVVGDQIAAAITAGNIPGAELAYAETTTNQTTTATTAATAGNFVTSPSYTFDGVTPCWVEFYCCELWHSVASSTVVVELYQDSTDLGILGRGMSAQTNQGLSLRVARKVTPASGAHVFSGRVWSPVAGTSSAGAGSGGAATDLPMFIRVTRV